MNTLDAALMMALSRMMDGWMNDALCFDDHTIINTATD